VTKKRVDYATMRELTALAQDAGKHEDRQKGHQDVEPSTDTEPADNTETDEQDREASVVSKI
jgi:hypothetical protein